MATTLPLFWNLSSSSKKDRIDSSVKLIGALEQFQANHVAQQRTPGGSESEDAADPLDMFNSPDVSYSIRRLIRGLASPRESSRLGFSVALTELLSRMNTVTCAQVISLISDSTKKQGSMTGQEERDVLFARLFGLTAVIRSGLLVRHTPLPSSGSSSTQVSSLRDYGEVLHRLLEIGDAKAWLRESAWWSVGLAIDTVQDSSVPWKADALYTALVLLFAKDKLWTPEKIAMTLKLQPLMPNHDWENVLAPVFKDRNLFASANLIPLGRTLKECVLDEEGSSGPGIGSWNPQLHFVWAVLFDRLLPSPPAKESQHGSFREFFRIVVDETLFSPTSSAERKYWGFQVFKMALTRVCPDQLPMLFTTNLMRSWINHLSKSDRYLHKISLDVAKYIQSIVQQNPKLGFPLVLQLTGVNGSQQFDKLTRTKTVESILTVMDTDGIKSYVLSLLEQVNTPEDAAEDASSVDSRRMWIAGQFTALVLNGSVPKSDEWIKIVLDWYTVNGLFTIRKRSESSSILALRAVPAPPFTKEFQSHCRTRLLGSLADLTGQITIFKRGDQTHKETAVASDGKFWISNVLATLSQLDKDTKHVVLLMHVEDEKGTLFGKVQKMLEKLGKVSDENREVARGFELVLASLVLRCRCGEEDSIDNLEACRAAASRTLAAHKMPKKGESNAASTDEDVEPIDILVDLLIGYLEHASAFTRSVANEAFSRVAPAVREATMNLIITQLERRDPAELAEEESVLDVESDDEEVDAEDGESSDEDESSSEIGDDEAANEMRRKVADALKANGVNVVQGDSSGDESDEDLMDDEQMMAVDEHLAELFRSQGGKRKSKQEVAVHREATHFKNRVLDLVDTFVRKVPQSWLNVRLVLPLVDLATKSGRDEKQLADKATGILGRLAKSKDVPADAARDEVETVLREVHQRIRKSHPKGGDSLLGQSSLYLCRILAQLGKEDAAVEINLESLKDYASRKTCRANVGFFRAFIHRFPALGSRLREGILAAASTAVNSYRRCQAFQLLGLVLNQPNKDEPPSLGPLFIKTLQQTVLDLANTAVDDQTTLTASQLKEMLRVVRQAQKNSPSSKVWDPDAWQKLHARLSDCNGFKSSSPLLNLCRQVEAAATQGRSEPRSSEGGKRKAEEVTDANSSNKSGRKKQRKSKS